MRRFLLWVILLQFIASCLAQSNQMSPEQAKQILTEAGEWPPRSYIDPEQAAALFHFNGKLKVIESARFGDTDNISSLLIKPEDNSFDHIRLAIGNGSTFVDQFQAMTNAWQSSDAHEKNPFIPLTLPGGAKGYFDGHGSIVSKSPDGRFDISIDVGLSDSRGSVNVTESNKGLIDGLTKGDDHGLKFLADAVSKIIPMAGQKYQEQVKARTEIQEAMNVLANLPTATVKPSPSLSPLEAAATPSPINLPTAVPQREQSDWLLITVIAVTVVGAIGWFLMHRYKRPQNR